MNSRNWPVKHTARLWLLARGRRSRRRLAWNAPQVSAFVDAGRVAAVSRMWRQK